MVANIGYFCATTHQPSSRKYANSGCSSPFRAGTLHRLLIIGVLFCGSNFFDLWVSDNSWTAAAQLDFTSMKIVQLRRQLRLRGLDRKGQREELVARLVEHDAATARGDIISSCESDDQKRDIRKKSVVPHDACHPNPCAPFGLCLVLPDDAQVGFSCLCSKDWYGNFCNQSRGVASSITKMQRRVSKEIEQAAERERQIAARAAEGELAELLAAARQGLANHRYPVWFKKHNGRALEPGFFLEFKFDSTRCGFRTESPTNIYSSNVQATAISDCGSFVVVTPDNAPIQSFTIDDVLRISPSMARARAKNIPKGRKQVSVWTQRKKGRKSHQRGTLKADRTAHSFDLVFKRGREDLEQWLNFVDDLLINDADTVIAGFYFRDKLYAQQQQAHVARSARNDANRRMKEKEDKLAQQAYLAAAEEVAARVAAAEEEEALELERAEHRLKSRLQKAIRAYRRGCTEDLPQVKKAALDELRELRGQIRIGEMMSDQKVVHAADRILTDNGMYETEAAQAARLRVEEEQHKQALQAMADKMAAANATRSLSLQKREQIIRERFLHECPSTATLEDHAIKLADLNTTLNSYWRQMEDALKSSNRSLEKDLTVEIHRVFEHAYKLKACINTTIEHKSDLHSALQKAGEKTMESNVNAEVHRSTKNAALLSQNTDGTNLLSVVPDVSVKQPVVNNAISSKSLPQIGVLPAKLRPDKHVATAGDDFDDDRNGMHSVHPRVVAGILRDIRTSMHEKNFQLLDFAIDRAETARMHNDNYPQLAAAKEIMLQHQKEEVARATFRRLVQERIEGLNDVSLATGRKLLNLSLPSHMREWRWAQAAVAEHFTRSTLEKLNRSSALSSTSFAGLNSTTRPIAGENEMPSIRELQLPAQRAQTAKRKAELESQQLQAKTDLSILIQRLLRLVLDVPTSACVHDWVSNVSKIVCCAMQTFRFIKSVDPVRTANVQRYIDRAGNASAPLEQQRADMLAFQERLSQVYGINPVEEEKSKITEAAETWTQTLHTHDGEFTQVSSDYESVRSRQRLVEERREYLTQRATALKKQLSVLDQVNGGAPVFEEVDATASAHVSDFLEGRPVSLAKLFQFRDQLFERVGHNTSAANVTQGQISDCNTSHVGCNTGQLVAKSLGDVAIESTATANYLIGTLDTNDKVRSFLEKHQNVQLIAHGNYSIASSKLRKADQSPVVEPTSKESSASHRARTRVVSGKAVNNGNGQDLASNTVPPIEELGHTPLTNHGHDVSNSQALTHDGVRKPALDGERASAGVWKQATSGDGRVYWWNTKTRETRWSNPTTGKEEAKMAAIPTDTVMTATPSNSQSYVNGNDNDNLMQGQNRLMQGQNRLATATQERSMQPAENVNLHPEEWREAKASDGRVYWWNVKTKESTWTRPSKPDTTAFVQKNENGVVHLSGPKGKDKQQQQQQHQQRRPFVDPVTGIDLPLPAAVQQQQIQPIELERQQLQQSNTIVAGETY